LRNFEEVVANPRIHRLRRFAIRTDKMDFQANCLSAAALIISAARSMSSSVL
jgi:hypothetical protein